MRVTRGGGGVSWGIRRGATASDEPWKEERNPSGLSGRRVVRMESGLRRERTAHARAARWCRTIQGDAGCGARAAGAAPRTLSP